MISDVVSSRSMMMCLIWLCVLKLGWMWMKVNVLFVKVSSSVRLVVI